MADWRRATSDEGLLCALCAGWQAAQWPAFTAHTLQTAVRAGRRCTQCAEHSVQNAAELLQCKRVQKTAKHCRKASQTVCRTQSPADCLRRCAPAAPTCGDIFAPICAQLRPARAPHTHTHTNQPLNQCTARRQLSLRRAELLAPTWGPQLGPQFGAGKCQLRAGDRSSQPGEIRNGGRPTRTPPPTVAGSLPHAAQTLPMIY